MKTDTAWVEAAASRLGMQIKLLPDDRLLVQKRDVKSTSLLMHCNYVRDWAEAESLIRGYLLGEMIAKQVQEIEAAKQKAEESGGNPQTS